MIRLLVVDDHAIVRSGLHMLLDGDDNVEIVGEAGTAAEALARVEQLKPQVVLMDIALPDENGIETTRKIKASHPATAVIALTIYDDEEYFFKMIEAGASGYVPKRAAPHELVTAIRAAAAGDVYLYPSLAKLLVEDYLKQENEQVPSDVGELSARQHAVLASLANGDTNGQIASQLGISPKTVARHRENIMTKLGLRSRTELVKYAIRKGIICP